MGPSIKNKCVLIIAGEASGDIHGARLVRAMQQKDPSFFFCGIGGRYLKDAGVRILADASDLCVVGLTEVVSKLPNLLKGMAGVKRLLKILRPDLLILIDFPDFNLRIAAAARKIGIPILYYISPQVWAWRSGRVEKIRKLVDHVAVILPFEEDFYRRHQVPATFVGHPLLDNTTTAENKNPAAQGGDTPVIGLFPGSREKEVERHLPIMLAAADVLNRRMKNMKFVISRAPTVKMALLEELISRHKGEISCEIMSNDVDKIFNRCQFAIVVSGTVSLEAAIAGTPMVIIYRVSPLSYLLGRALIKVRFAGLVNLIEGREVVPELIQNDATPDNIANRVYALMAEPAGLEKLKGDLLAARKKLGGPGASERTAAIALGMVNPA